MRILVQPLRSTFMLLRWEAAGFSVPVQASYNHEAEASDDALTFPIAIGISKTMVKGKRINKFAIALTYNAVRPESFAPEWTLKLTWTPVIDNPFIRK